jgi:MerR family transcriptional regulator, copper efflux regulator
MKRPKVAVEAMRKSAAARRGERLRIGEVAALSGVGVEALRFYERAGLIDRPRRTEGGYRLYEADVLERLAFVKRAQVLGFSLDEIAHLIAERRAGRIPCAEVRSFVRDRLGELDRQMAEMRRYRRELAELLQAWEQVDDGGGQVCGLIEGAHFRRAEGASHAPPHILKRTHGSKRKREGGKDGDRLCD